MNKLILSLGIQTVHVYKKLKKGTIGCSGRKYTDVICFGKKSTAGRQTELKSILVNLASSFKF